MQQTTHHSPAAHAMHILRGGSQNDTTRAHVDMLRRERDHLALMHAVLGAAVGELDPARILARADSAMRPFLPVREVLGVVWPSHAITTFVRDDLLDREYTSRVAYLVERACVMADRCGMRTEERRYAPEKGSEMSAWSVLDTARPVLVPLHHGENMYGCLVVMLAADVRHEDIQVLRDAALQLSGPLYAALDYERMRALADHDGLTGVYNRRAFDERLEQESSRHLRNGRDFSLLMMDIDHFKNVNDNYGHPMGDAVLRQLADILTETVRSTDVVARYGGEEFVVILPETHINDATKLAERLRRRVEKTEFEHAGTTIHATVSVGVASRSCGSLTPSAEMIRRADQALYEAKRTGRNRICLEAACQEDSPAHRILSRVVG